MKHVQAYIIKSYQWIRISNFTLISYALQLYHVPWQDGDVSLPEDGVRYRRREIGTPFINLPQFLSNCDQGLRYLKAAFVTDAWYLPVMRQVILIY